MVHKTVAGVLPDEWKGSLIKHVCKVVRGSSPRPAGSPLYFDGNFLPWATVADLTNSEDMYLTLTKSMLTEAGAERTRITGPGTLMLTNSGATLGVPKISAIRCGANDGIAMLLNLDGIATEFAYYYLSSKTQYFRDVIAPGVGQPNLNTELIGDFPIPVPPLPETKKIAKILSTLDKVISTTEQLLANSQQQKKALMQQLLTGKKRVLDKNGVRFSGEWRWLKASELFKTISRKNNSETEELLAVTQDQGVLPRSMLERRVVMPDGSTQGYKLVVPGNFIISLRSFQGGLEYSSYRGLVSPAYTVLEPIRLIDDEFYKQYYKSYDFIGHLAVAVIGIRDGKQISYEDFSFLKLPYPSLEEQQKIAAVLSTADQEISALQQKLDVLKQEKKALMQQLLTGKRRVKVEEAA